MKQSTTTSIKVGRKTKKAATKGKRKTKKCLGKKRKVRNRRRTYKKRGGGHDEKLKNIKNEIDDGNIDELTKRFSFNPRNFVKGLNAKYIDNNGLLAYAAGYNKLDIVQLFLKKGADANKDEDGWSATPLNLASGKGYLEVVKALIAAEADVNKASSGMTPLHRASNNGRLDVVNELIKNKADVNMADDDGLPPIWWASYNGRRKVVEALKKAGADVEVSEKARAEGLADVKAAQAKELARVRAKENAEGCQASCNDNVNDYSHCVDQCLKGR
jgi:ankyrin repeat protein